MPHWFRGQLAIDRANAAGAAQPRHRWRARDRSSAKIEGRNPAYSVKCRIGAAMVWDAEKRGLLGPGKELVEPTSGNTGIALAFVAAARKIPADPDDARDDEHRAPQAAARLRREAGADRGRARDERRDREGRGDRRLGIPSATSCCSSSRIPPIPRSTRRRPDRKSGTTPTARSTFSCRASARAARSPASRATSRRRAARRFFRSPSSPPPARCSRSSAPVSRSSRRAHKIQGIGAGFVPDILDLSLVDVVEQVTNEEAIRYARRLTREEGILSGISSRRRRGGRGRGSRSVRRTRAKPSSTSSPTRASATSAPRCSRTSSTRKGAELR